MTRRRHFVVVMTFALVSAANRAGAEYPDAWRWTLSVGPSAFAPRMHNLDRAMTTGGIVVLDRDWREAGAGGGDRVTTGFAKVEWGFGGQVTIGYEFNEDMRGGVMVGVDNIYKKDSNPAITATSTYMATATVMITTSTTYSVSARTSLPLVSIGVFLHKVFRYDEEPALRTYIGGWGAYGALTGASIATRFQIAGATTSRAFTTSLTAQGWAAGGLGGIEYMISPTVALFGESGFTYCVIPNIQWLGRTGGGGRLTDSNGRPIELDFSGFYIRIGVKLALASPS